MNYQESLAFLQSFPDLERMPPDIAKGRRLKMPVDAMRAFLTKMGNPQNYAKTIHITGSKGKGSTATFIASILQWSGYRTALFTSPHMHSFTERLAFNMQAITKEDFAEGLSAIKPFICDFEQTEQVFSTFGILTALFFYLVKNAKPVIDWQIVEVGLGGKDDLTNVFTEKEAAVITAISLEHTNILGKTPLQIAENKAGIITDHCLTVLAQQSDNQVTDVIKEICQEKQSSFISTNNIELPCSLQMAGEHQIENAKTALALCQSLSKKFPQITELSIKDGLAAVSLPGRFEIVRPGLILDAAHNGESATALVHTLEQTYPNQKIIFILGVNEDKNLEDIFLAVKGISKAIIATCSNNARSMPAEEIVRRILLCDPLTPISNEKDIEAALKKAQTLKSMQDIICICGSFYLVAEARANILALTTSS